ncbi:MAG: hypothetical protein M3310_06465, partial [Actinomycetota bacterium]|nr:hypothetical protein [Actinomycetota bacterium]
AGTTRGTPPTEAPDDTAATTTSRRTARATARPFAIGVWEYFFRDADQARARAKAAEARAAGFDTMLTTAIWKPGQRRPPPLELLELRHAAEATRAAGIRPMLIVTNFGSRTTPRTPAYRRQFAAFAVSLLREIPAYRDIVVGNEPNLNRFWLPQFGPNGENVAARDYLALLAETYDAVKRVSEEIRVIGGALAPRGGDDPGSPRQTHSPTQFIRDLGRLYRASGRERPVMDAYAHHPYLESSRVPPDLEHPRSTTISLADYGKLVRELGHAFGGTAQRGAKLPILYTEFGVQTRIPPGKRSLYTNHDAPAAADAVSEATQARYYRRAYTIACRQPTVEGLFIFHVWDELDLAGWQSGLYYADRSPKSSRRALRELRSCR